MRIKQALFLTAVEAAVYKQAAMQLAKLLWFISSMNTASVDQEQPQTTTQKPKTKKSQTQIKQTRKTKQTKKVVQDNDEYSISSYRMPFGKYRGWSLSYIPSSYIRWLARLGTLREPLASAVQQEYEARVEDKLLPQPRQKSKSRRVSR